MYGHIRIPLYPALAWNSTVPGWSYAEKEFEKIDTDMEPFLKYARYPLKDILTL